MPLGGGTKMQMMKRGKHWGSLEKEYLGQKKPQHRSLPSVIQAHLGKFQEAGRHLSSWR